MADAASNVPPSSAPVKSASEDPDTAAARKELKQTAISDGKPDLAPVASSPDSNDDDSARTSTPDLADGKMKQEISSPKKKRAHAELSKPANGDSTAPAAAANDSSQDEPEKKRPRDVSSEAKATFASATPANVKTEGSPKKTTPEKAKPATTSSSAFSVSGMSAFSSASSPFLQAGGKTLSSFASGSGGSASPFAAAGSQSPGKSTFGSGSALSGGASPFGQVGGPAKTLGASPFASASAPRGSQLTSFGSTGGTFKSSKPAKPFGAPASDVEESDEEASDDDEDDKNTGDGDKDKEQDKDKEADDDKSTTADDKKRAKYQKVATDTGEDGEATMLSVRAKIFNLDKTTQAWKERGAGNLKINVPLSCVDIDEENGNPIPGSFDASGLEDAESKVVRLIARQDSTHRVILNTAVIPAMVFQDKPTTKAVCVLFTALEGSGEAVSIQVKMSAANAKLFINEIGKIQRELQAA